MANVTLFDQTGKQAGEVVLNDAIFGIEPNQSVVFDVIISQRASLRQGTHAVKNRSAVSGGGRKPWRQKGTGRARQGSISEDKRNICFLACLVIAKRITDIHGGFQIICVCKFTDIISRREIFWVLCILKWERWLLLLASG